MGSFKTYLQKNTDAAPLAVFRVLFGMLMLISLVRFYEKGWIEEFYIKPVFFFSYYGFDWVQPIGEYTYLIFLICAISSLFVAIGFKYRVSVLIFFLSFTWIELMDKTTYLNHYYFISVLSFLMVFLPAHTTFSIDAFRNQKIAANRVPAWCIDSIKLILSIVYFYAGLAKLSPDWLFHAMPMKIWLPANQNLPVIGSLFTLNWTPYLFSWAGVVFDLSIPFLLWKKSTRKIAYAAVVVFHLVTRILFPIGMFPFIMILSTLIFFDAAVHRKILNFLAKPFRHKTSLFNVDAIYRFPNQVLKRISVSIIAALFLIQLVFPFRYLLYPGNLFWTEGGYRFGWRVMLMEKYGRANFIVIDSETGKKIPVMNSDYLTPMQEKQMATQPDFILEYAHFLDDAFSEKGVADPQVYAESFVTLNGQRSQQFVKPTVDLSKIDRTTAYQEWIVPYIR